MASTAAALTLRGIGVPRYQGDTANLLSAVFGVLAVLVLHRLCLALLNDRLAA